jgi:alginate O-acetyltransferase complex protein AlgI
LFPQLIAGPIVRARDIQVELGRRTVGMQELTDGFSRFVWGLAKKMLIADSIAPLVEAAYSAEPTMASAWIAAVGFAVQIYFDFSGYSDMAIGLGTMLGFTFPENFDRPYVASTITDFWRRWHITLSTWFRDYLYIPLGGNHGGPLRQAATVIATMTLAGLWHGAGWTFLLWGFLHGAGLAGERGLRRAGLVLPRSLGAAAAFTFVVLMWIPFRSASLTDTVGLFAAFTRSEAMAAPALTPFALSLIGVGLAMNWLPLAWRDGARAALARRGPAVQAVVLGLGVWVLFAVTQDGVAPFIYFQF